MSCRVDFSPNLWRCLHLTNFYLSLLSWLDASSSANNKYGILKCNSILGNYPLWAWLFRFGDVYLKYILNIDFYCIVSQGVKMIRLMRLYEVETFVFLLHNFSIYYQVLSKVRFDKVFILLVGKFHLLNSICLCL